MVGTNGAAAFALAGACERGTRAMREHRAQLVRVEHAAVVRGWRAQVRTLRTRTDAQRMLDALVSQCKLDPPLRALVQHYVARRLTAKLRALPTEAPPPPPNGDKGTLCAQRPQLRLLCATFSASTVLRDDETEEEECAKYVLWTCNAAAPGGRWKRAGFEISARGGVPAVAFNETHVALVCPAGAGVRVSVYRVGEYGVVELRPERTVCFAFPDEYGDDGLMSAHMGADGALAVAFGSGVVVVPPSSSGEEEGMTLSSVRVDGAEGEGGGAVVTSVSLAAGDSVLALGTSLGVCFGVCTRTLEARWMDCVPAVEPVVGVGTSNGRIVMQTITGVCGRMLPFVPGSGLTFVPLPRPLCAGMCGTLLFVVDKYGGVQLLSTVVRHVSFPFRPPPEPFAVVPDAPFYYGALHAAPARVTCLYPDGTLRILELAK
jgi:hypothetical protein